MIALPVFTKDQMPVAKRLLATCVGQMMGRKFEEGDWSSVYCRTKGIPEAGWSNLNIDVAHNGMGVEHKMLCVPSAGSLMSLAGTTRMHPSATRSIRIDTSMNAEAAMRSIFQQYAELIDARTAKVQEITTDGLADMRTGWLLWERSLTEFLYFEERMEAPLPQKILLQIGTRTQRKVHEKLVKICGSTRRKLDENDIR